VTGAITNIINCGIFGGWSYGIFGGTLVASEKWVVYNNTIVDCVTYGMWNDGNSGADIYIKNNIVDNCGTDYSIASVDASSGNYSSDNTDPQINGSNSFTFTNKSAGDLHLSSSHDGAFEGTDLSTDAHGFYSFSTDIDGDTRVDWDAGIDEIIAAASSLLGTKVNVEYNRLATN